MEEVSAMKRNCCVRILGCLALLSLILALIFGTVWQNVWLLGMGAEEWIFFAAWSTVVLLVLTLAALWLSRYPRHRVAVVIVTVLVLCVALVFAFAQYVFRADCDYYTFVSPDGQRTVIIREESFLFASWGTFYEQTSPVTIEKIGSFDLHDAFPNGNYTFQWGKTGCEVTFCGESVALTWVK